MEITFGGPQPKDGPRCESCAKRPAEGREWCRFFTGRWCPRYVYANKPVEDRPDEEPAGKAKRKGKAMEEKAASDGAPKQRAARKRPVVLVERATGKVVKRFESCAQAAFASGNKKEGTVRDQCLHRRTPKGEFVYRFEDDYSLGEFWAAPSAEYAQGGAEPRQRRAAEEVAQAFLQLTEPGPSNAEAPAAPKAEPRGTWCFGAVRDDAAVSRPDHYVKGGMECIDAIRAVLGREGFKSYCHGNVLKYMWRWRDKGGMEDLAKARVYLGWLIDGEEEGGQDVAS